MKHIFIIDPLEKLVVEKDSTLLLAHTLSSRGVEVYVSFEKDWFFESGEHEKRVRCFKFNSSISDKFYLERFECTDEEEVVLDGNVMVQMRKDPPFDRSYLHMCWILQEVVKTGAKVINDPSQLLMINEKLIAYADKKTIPTLIAKDVTVGTGYAEKLKNDGYSDVIVKPLDLYQGIGVQKAKIDDSLGEVLKKAVEDYQGVYVLQPFIKKVEEGEIRSVFFAGEHIGSIIKVPPKGSFLANIAQGAKYESIDLDEEVMQNCLEYSKDLHEKGVPFTAFDILDGKISEINITCPGLLVEVASAHSRNVCEQICDLLLENYK